MTLSAAEREYLSQQWRWLEQKNDALRARHPGAREIELGSPFVTLAGATAAMTIISSRLTGDTRQIVATIDKALTLTFAKRPRTVRVFHRRFELNVNTDIRLYEGGDPLFDGGAGLYEAFGGKLMLCQRADVDYGERRTTLYLTG